MQQTTFPAHTVMLSTPEDKDVLSGEEPPLGTLIFIWGLRDADLKLVAPLMRYDAQGVDPDTMIALGEQLVSEGERLKELAGGAQGSEPGSDPDSPSPVGPQGPWQPSSGTASEILVPELILPAAVAEAVAEMAGGRSS